MEIKHTVKDRFLKYVKIDTQSDPYSETSPSTEKQKNLSKVLYQELKEMGVKDVELNDFGYVYASIPATSDKKVPSLCFCAHVDTAPDCSGTDVKPIIHENYKGQEIVLPDDRTQILNVEIHPNLNNKIGHDIITASGLTLLGSDDKSGVAEIMDAAYNLINNPSIKHGPVKILFTTDEEIGRGVANVELDKIGADFGFTLDGGDIGSFEYENFSADKMLINVQGVSAHPGYAKGKMENAIKIASEIVARFPKSTLSPESTELKQGFIHPNRITGALENASIELIIRDFDTSQLEKHENLLKEISNEVLKDYPNSSVSFDIKAQYRNMKDIIDKHPQLTENTITAFERLGMKPTVHGIRGGTDGAVLSHMGLPCPNIFAGEQAIHSKHEWVSVQDMEKAVLSIIEICKVFEEKA